MLVHVVRQHPDVRMFHQHVGERLKLGLGIGGAGRIGRRVEDQPLGLRRDRLFERVRRQLEAVVDGGSAKTGVPPQIAHHFGIAHPVGARDHYLVARVERRHQGVEQDLLAAGADDRLLRLVVEVVLALELVGDRLAQRHECPTRADISSRRGEWRRSRRSLMLSGVSKSGSPAPRPMTSRPFAFRSRAFWATAIVAEGFTRERASARKAMISTPSKTGKMPRFSCPIALQIARLDARRSEQFRQPLTGDKSLNAILWRETRRMGLRPSTEDSPLSRSVGLAHIIRQDDGTSSGVWGTFTLRSAFQPVFAFQNGKLSIAAFEGLVRPARDGELLRLPHFFQAFRRSIASMWRRFAGPCIC